jgi:hypothetical protein
MAHLGIHRRILTEAWTAGQSKCVVISEPARLAP